MNGDDAFDGLFPGLPKHVCLDASALPAHAADPPRGDRPAGPTAERTPRGFRCYCVVDVHSGLLLDQRLA
jgi:hypothetical protein